METEKNVSETALKRLERDRQGTAATQEAQIECLKSGSELRRKS